MDDRELLELAGKAQGWIDYPTDSSELGAYWHIEPQLAPFGPRIPKTSWDPLNNDGDALRLMHAIYRVCGASTTDHWIRIYDNLWGGDLAATRRAIVRAAAAIGAAL